ncbi:uncharacterized protein LOC123529776 [Mercenaria mercenaria]|uniref:uncharacterized protein LOC123529776 n=1 Tax=Mercenaria mercenaria TaxID=6596 RepID=UPI001E1D92EA|nr:uncharacterized protein LOC123529776 [Mercenaria mercenaria]
MKEEVTRLREESLKRLNAIAEKVAADKGIVNRKDANEHVRYICSLYGSFADKMTPEELQNFRNEVANIIVESSILEYLTQVVVAYPADVYSNIATYKDTHLLFLTLTLISYYTGCSDTLSDAVAETDILVFCKRFLTQNSEGHLNGELKDILEKILHACFCKLHNLSMREASVERLRDLDFTKAIQPYLKSPDDEISLTAIAVLANTVNETECNVIEANVPLVAKLLYFLQKGMEEESRTYEGWSCKNSGRAVRNLAKNDANKKLLWNLNAMRTLVDLAKTGDEKEQLESVHAIWALCFDEEIRKDVVNDKDSKVVNVLLDLEKTTTNDSIKNACAKCLWTLKQELSTSTNKSNQEAVKVLPQTVSTQPSKGHIMISYQSQNRDVLIKIKGSLEEKNYKVWMDIEQMGGSTLQAMAEGVENALVVLICYSRKYKESENCRLEAEYTQELRKPFIPLKMERGYKPDGWLGLMIGSRYFVEFSGKYKFEDKLVDLYRELDRILKPEAVHSDNTAHDKAELQNKTPSGDVGNAVEAGIGDTRKAKNYGYDIATGDRTGNAQAEYIGSRKIALEKIKHMRKWSQDDVFKWLSKYNLQNNGLDELTGEEIWLLAKVMCETPGKLYDFMEKDLKVDSLRMKSRLVWALDDTVTS